MRPKILVVDDKRDIVSTIKRYLDDLPDHKREHYGIDEFLYDEAFDGETAMAKLKAAKDSSSPYSLVLLDLELPWREGDDLEEIGIGFEILKYTIEENAALGVIVVSIYSQYKSAIQAFPRIDIDFVAKPFSEETLQQQVLSYFEREGLRILDRRIKELAPHAQKGLAYQLGVCFSGFVQKVVNETEGLKIGFSERWGLDVGRDTQDPHARRLIALDKAIENAKAEWNELQSILVSGDEKPKVYILEKLLNEISARVLPCLLLKNVEIKNVESLKGETKILSFENNVQAENDVQTVLAELILGALSELSHHDTTTRSINVFVKIRKEYAEVRLEDDFPVQISHENAERINGGDVSIADPRMGRSWGLSLAQYISLRGGGRLTVEPRNNRGSLITYRIPLARHA